MTKVLVSLDEGLLARIDREAHARGLSRSAYLARAAERDLGITHAGPGADPHVRAAIGALRVLGSAVPARKGAADATEAIRKDRDSH